LTGTTRRTFWNFSNFFSGSPWPHPPGTLEEFNLRDTHILWMPLLYNVLRFRLHVFYVYFSTNWDRVYGFLTPVSLDIAFPEIILPRIFEKLAGPEMQLVVFVAASEEEMWSECSVFFPLNAQRDHQQIKPVPMFELYGERREQTIGLEWLAQKHQTSSKYTVMVRSLGRTRSIQTLLSYSIAKQVPGC